MRSAIAVFALVSLSSCATRSDVLMYDKPPMRTYESAKAPLDVGRCILDHVRGTTIYPGTDVVTVSLRNQFDSILIDWRIYPTPTGSRIDLRRQNTVAPGIRAAQVCF